MAIIKSIMEIKEYRELQQQQQQKQPLLWKTIHKQMFNGQNQIRPRSSSSSSLLSFNHDE